jgi:hypothetical protein
MGSIKSDYGFQHFIRDTGPTKRRDLLGQSPYLLRTQYTSSCSINLFTDWLLAWVILPDMNSSEELKYSYSSKPRAVQTNRSKAHGNQPPPLATKPAPPNIMHDPRIVRGTVLAAVSTV